MNRTAKCIQMLILLKNKNIVSIEELAQKLNTNPRNIREYKKELVEAGYTIHSYRGSNGGYQLDHRARLILPQLTNEEIHALIHVNEYWNIHRLIFNIETSPNCLSLISSFENTIKIT